MEKFMHLPAEILDILQNEEMLALRGGICYTAVDAGNNCTEMDNIKNCSATNNQGNCKVHVPDYP